MTKGNDVNKDFEKGMQSFAKQLKILQNNIKSLGVLASGVADTIGIDLISALNSALEKMREMADDTSKFGLLTNGLSDSLITLTMALAGFVALKFPLVQMGKAVSGMASGLGGLFGLGALGSGALFAGIAILATGLLTAYSIHKRIVLQRQYELELQEELIRKTEAQIQANDALLNNIEAQQNMLANMANTDYTKSWDKAYDIISSITEKSSELKAILEATEKIKTFNLPEMIKVDNIQKEVLANTKKQLDLILQTAKEEDKAYQKKIKSLNADLQASQERLMSLHEETSMYIDTEAKLLQFIDKYRLLERAKRENGGMELAKEKAREILTANQEAYNYELENYKSYEHDKLKLNEKFHKARLREDFDYAKKYAMVELSRQKISEETIENARKNIEDSYKKMKFTQGKEGIPVTINYDFAISEDFGVIQDFLEKYKGETLLEAVDKASLREIEILYNALSEEARESLGLAEYKNAILKVQSDNLTKINQKAMELSSYYEQIATTVAGMEYQAFSDMLEKTSVSGVDQYINLAESMGFEEVVKGVEMMRDRLSDIELTKLIDDKNLLKAISETKGIEKAIQNLQDSLKNGKAVEALDKLKKSNAEVFNTIDSAYKGVRDNTEDYVNFMIDKLNKILEVQLKAMLAVDPNLIKSAFYQDKAKLMELELLKVRQDGIQQMLTEQEILKENTKLRKETLDLQLRGLGESQLKETRKTMIAEKKALEAKKEAQLKGGLNLITSEDIKRSEELDKNIEAITEELEAINNEKIKEVELNNKIIDQINKISQDAKKVSDSFASINNKSRSFAQLIGVVGEDTKNSLIQLSKRKKIEMDELATNVKKLNLKKNLTAQEAKELTQSKERIKNSEEQVKLIKERLKNVEELEKRQVKIDSNLKKAEEIRNKVTKYGKNEYDLAVERNKELDEEIESTQLKLSGEKDAEKSAELQLKWRNLQLEKEQAITAEVQARNNLINQAITGTGQIINLLAGADSVLGQNFGAISPMLGELFTGGATFQKTMTGFQAMTTAGGVGGVSQLAGMGMALGGAGAIASMAMPIADAVFGTSEKSNAKAEARFKKEYELSQKQLEALKSMSAGIKSYSDKIVEALMKMPTFTELTRQRERVKPVAEQIAKGGLNLSDVVFKRKGGKDWRGKKKYKTITRDVEDFLIEMVRASGIQDIPIDIQETLDGEISKSLKIDDLSLENLKSIETEMKKIGDWNVWIKKELGSAKGVVKNNIAQIQGQISEYIYAYEKMNDLQENLMKEATVGAFKSAEYVNILETRKEYEELGAQLFSGFKNNSAMISEFVETQMQGIEDITSQAGIKVRESIIDGVSQGLSETEILTNAFRNIFEDMSYDINSVITDVVFDETYDNIKNLTKKATDELVKLKEEFIKTDYVGNMGEDVSEMLKQDYIPNMMDAIKATQGLDEATLNLNMTMRESMMQTGEFSQDFIDKMFPIENALSESANKIRDYYLDALKTENYTSAIKSLTSSISDDFIDGLLQKSISGEYEQKIVQLSTKYSDLLAQGFSIQSLQQFRSEANSLMIEMQNAQNQALAYRDLLSVDMGDAKYETINESIKYETGSTQTIHNNYYTTNEFNFANFFSNEQNWRELARRISDYQKGL